MAKERKRSARRDLDEVEERLEDVPEPDPGQTAPLDEVTEEESQMEPTGVMPGAGPDDRPESGDRGDEEIEE
jgi:hypothetical protein